MTLHMAPVFAKHQKRLEENHYQFSIYDFIGEEEIVESVDFEISDMDRITNFDGLKPKCDICGRDTVTYEIDNETLTVCEDANCGKNPMRRDNSLPKEKSQEVAPSETLPQVDEAQEYIIPAYPQTVDMALDMFNYDDEKFMADLIASKNIPSSALDTSKKPTEDTDKTSDLRQEKTLFSVGDIVKVRNAKDIYDINYFEEDFAHVDAHSGMEGEIENITIEKSGTVLHVRLGIYGGLQTFYSNELQKI